MIKAEITLTDDALEQVRAALEYFTGNNGKTIAPNTAKAFNQVVRIVQKSWQNWAMGGKKGGLPNDDTGYVYFKSQHTAHLQLRTLQQLELF